MSNVREWVGGKGSLQHQVDKKKFDENFDRIFGKKQDNEDDLEKVVALDKFKD